MMDKDIDEISRSAFPDGDVAFDAKYWDQMSAMIAQRKKKRGFIFWWGTGGLIVLLIGGLFMYSSNKNKSQNVASINKEVAEHISDVQESVSSTENNFSGSIASGSSQLKNDPLHTDNENIQDPNPTSNQGYNESKNSNATTNTNSKNRNNVGSTVSYSSIPTRENERENVLKSENLNNFSPQQTGHIAGAAGSDNGVVKKEIAVSSSYISNAPSSVISKTNTASPEENLPINGNANRDLELNTLISSINPIESGQFTVHFNRINLYEMPNDTSFKKSETEFQEVVPNNSKLKYFIEPIIGFNSSSKTVLSEGISADTTFDIEYLPTQELQFGLNLGAKYENFYGAIGVHFNQINSSINVNESRIELESFQDISSRTIVDKIDSILIKTPIIKVPEGSDFAFQPGESEYSIDTTFATVYDTTNTSKQVEKLNKSTLNYRLQYLYIPIQIGYEYPIKNFFFGGGMGLDLGVLINSNGELFDPELNQIIDIDAADLVNKTTLAYNLHVAVGYYLKPNLSVALRPNMRQQIINSFKNTNLPNTRLGGFVSLRYVF